MDLAVKQTIINIGHSYRFLSIAIAYGSLSIKHYEKRHKFYLDNYKKITGEDFIFPEGIRKLI